MRFPALGRRDKDVTRLEYNDYVTLTGIPAQAQGYSISGRSPLEWIIDRYHVKTDKASGIVNDPNDFLREQGRPDAVVDLIKRLVTVSMRTQELVTSLSLSWRSQPTPNISQVCVAILSSAGLLSTCLNKFSVRIDR